MLRRTRSGIERDDFETRTGFNLDVLCGCEIERFVAQGYLEDNGRRIRLTPEGIFVADHVLCELL